MPKKGSKPPRKSQPKPQPKRRSTSQPKKAPPLRCKLSVVPLKGDAIERDLAVPAEGASYAALLEAAGVAVEGRDVLIDGAPAPVSALVMPGQSIRVAERPQGS